MRFLPCGCRQPKVGAKAFFSCTRARRRCKNRPINLVDAAAFAAAAVAAAVGDYRLQLLLAIGRLHSVVAAAADH